MKSWFVRRQRSYLPVKASDTLLPILCAIYSDVQTSPAAPIIEENTAAVQVCNNEMSEAWLLQKETAILGATHAQEHAAVRARQCRVAAGLERTRKLDTAKLAAAALLSPDTAGQWSAPISVPVAGVSAVLLHTGKVLFWSYDPSQWANPYGNNTGVAYIWDPVARTGKSVTPPENIWCGGQTLLSDGRVYVAGGNLRYPNGNAPAGQTGWEGSLSHYTFNPLTSRWIRQLPDMSVGRWYPTTTRLADNRVVVTSGYDQTGGEYITNTVEVFTPSLSMDGNGALQTISSHDPTGLYPFQFLVSSGQMLQAGPWQDNSFLLTPDTWSWSALPSLRKSHYGNGNGIIYTDASATPVKQRVLIAGGQSGPDIIGDVEMLDTAARNVGWQTFPNWRQARHNANTVVLPDGALLTIGGNSATTNYDGTLFHAELYSKAVTDPSGTWVEVAPNTLPAAYHSSALLLPDATVLLSQDDADKSPSSTHRVQIYTPPYLFRGARPKITSAPSAATWGQSFQVNTDTKNISHVSLIAPGAVTHGNDMHQRGIRLPVKAINRGGNVQITIPTSPALVPAGYYMLFVINANGVPSLAKFIRIA